MSEWLGAYGRIARVAFRQAYGDMHVLLYVLVLLVRPITQVIFFGIAARFATGQSDVSFQVIGNAIQVCALSSLITTAGVLGDERSNGTLSLVTLAARQRFMVFAGRLLVVGMHGLVTSVAALSVGALAFGIDLSRVSWGGLALALVATVAATSALGIALGAVGLVVTDLNLIGNVMMVGLMAICNINFPVGSLPGWLQVVAHCLPMTRGSQAARVALAGGGPEFLPLILGELLVGAVWLLFGYGLYRYLEHKARVHGTLDLY